MEITPNIIETTDKKLLKISYKTYLLRETLPNLVLSMVWLLISIFLIYYYTILDKNSGFYFTLGFVLVSALVIYGALLLLFRLIFVELLKRTVSSGNIKRFYSDIMVFSIIAIGFDVIIPITSSSKMILDSIFLIILTIAFLSRFIQKILKNQTTTFYSEKNTIKAKTTVTDFFPGLSSQKVLYWNVTNQGKMSLSIIQEDLPKNILNRFRILSKYYLGTHLRINFKSYTKDELLSNRQLFSNKHFEIGICNFEDDNHNLNLLNAYPISKNLSFQKLEILLQSIETFVPVEYVKLLPIESRIT
jgi:signal transduction histidine kinase